MQQIPGSFAADSLLSIEQAHLAWMAEVSDVEMVAAISYVETLYRERHPHHDIPAC